jgi:Undecaprenyl-phosphate galactose phosphotransferase WbaP
MSTLRLEPLARLIPLAPSLHASPRTTLACIIFSDILVVLCSSLAGVALWSLVNPSISQVNTFHPAATLPLFLLIYLANGLYQPAGLNPVDELRRSVSATALVSLILTASAFFNKDAELYSRGALLATAALAAVCIPLGRALLRCLCAQRHWWGVPVVILGAGPPAAALIQNLKRNPALGFKPVACLDDHSTANACSGVPIAGPLASARFFAPRVRHAIIALSNNYRTSTAAASFRHIIILPNLDGVASLWVTPRDLAGILALDVRQNLLIPFNQFLKRAMDICLATAALILSVPLIAAAMAAIKLASPGPALFFHPRTGFRSAPLLLPKLRTMYTDAEARLHSHLSASPEALDEWNRFFKLRDDPRIIPAIGRLLRRSSLDEIPQLWCVLKGEMSLVGPRPLPAYHMDKFDPEFRDIRSRVRPGLTGLWQVSARGSGLSLHQQLDSYYIRNWSPWLDLYILARTVRVVLTGDGAR